MHAPYLYYNTLYSNILSLQTLEPMHQKVPTRDYEPNQVVFLKTEQPRDSWRPAKIVIKSGYGTYKVKVYGVKEQEYVSEYLISEYTVLLAEQLAQRDKRNKKQLKLLKAAAKDNELFDEHIIPEVKEVKMCKEEEEEEDGNIILPAEAPKYRLKSQVIQSIKISALIADYHATKQTTLTYTFLGQERTQTQRSKALLIKRLLFALEEISLGKSSQKTENVVVQILNSEIIEPKEYVVYRAYEKLKSAIQYLKQSKQTKLKNYLSLKKDAIMQGFQNYLSNCALFFRVHERFHNIMESHPDPKQSAKNESQGHNVSYPQLNMTGQ